MTQNHACFFEVTIITLFYPLVYIYLIWEMIDKIANILGLRLDSHHKIGKSKVKLFLCTF